MSMNIHTEPGERVIVTRQGLENGFDYDRKLAKRHLIEGMEYTVEKTKFGEYRTSVFLKEIPRMSFNSVHFENVK